MWIMSDLHVEHMQLLAAGIVFFFSLSLFISTILYPLCNWTSATSYHKHWKFSALTQLTIVLLFWFIKPCLSGFGQFMTAYLTMWIKFFLSIYCVGRCIDKFIISWLLSWVGSFVSLPTEWWATREGSWLMEIVMSVLYWWGLIILRCLVVDNLV